MLTKFGAYLIQIIRLSKSKERECHQFLNRI